MMDDLFVSIEINGKQVSVGKITGNDSRDARFSYDAAYMETGAPISISLPFTHEAFSAEKTRNFFEGLLPEGFSKKAVARWIHSDESDYLSILNSLGNECLGAIRITDGKTQIDNGYDRLDIDQVKALAAEGATKSTEILVKTHLSLAGASGKVGLYYDPSNDDWYLPKGLNPSTHIVKQSHVRLRNIVTNEQLCLLTAKNLGIEVPESFIINAGTRKDEDILFATKRYDRLPGEKTFSSDGSQLNIPLRLHQEDFAQAAGIASARKYEDENSSYLVAMMDILRKHSSNPIEDQKKLWKIIIFNWIIGNTDAHIKNYSLLYSPDMNAVRLAPAYDIISTVIYPNSTRNMSFKIGGAKLIDDITGESFVQAAGESYFGKKMVISIINDICDRFESALNNSAYDLKELGFDMADDIKEKILKLSPM